MSSKGNLLVVDDEPDFVEIFALQLREKGYFVSEAASGKAALEELNQHDIDVLITDIRMPGMDGIELVKRATERQSDLQCIIITGHEDVNIAKWALELGGLDFYFKPLMVEWIEVTIQKAIERQSLLGKKQKENKQQGVEKAKIRMAIFELMNHAMQLWDLSTKTSKINLAEESGIWNITFEANGPRVYNLDRYLKIKTIPVKPNYNDVIKTANYVLEYCPRDSYPNLRQKLETDLISLEKIRYIVK